MTIKIWNSFPLTPQDLPGFVHWLAEHGIQRPMLRWCEPGDEALFVAIAAARCTACGGGLDYLDPRIHDIEAPQFVCKPCGGLYELSTFVSSGT